MSLWSKWDLGHFDPEAKKQSMQWKHPGSTPSKKFKSFFRREGDDFMDSQGIIMMD